MASPSADRGFVSHSHVDQEFAERLVGVLRRHRIPVWYSDTDMQGAQQWHDEIGRALQRCSKASMISLSSLVSCAIVSLLMIFENPERVLVASDRNIVAKDTVVMPDTHIPSK